MPWKTLDGKLPEQAMLQQSSLAGLPAERHPALGRPAFFVSRAGCFQLQPLDPLPSAGSRAAAVAEHDPAGGPAVRCPLCSAGLSLELERPSPLFACPGCDQRAAPTHGMVEKRCRPYGSLMSVAPQQERLQVQYLQIW